MGPLDSMTTNLPAEPQTPLTGSGIQRRSLPPQQDGNGESETDFGVMPGENYRVPARPESLSLEAHREHPLLTLRRKVQPDFGRRTL